MAASQKASGSSAAAWDTVLARSERPPRGMLWRCVMPRTQFASTHVGQGPLPTFFNSMRSVERTRWVDANVGPAFLGVRTRRADGSTLGAADFAASSGEKPVPWLEARVCAAQRPRPPQSKFALVTECSRVASAHASRPCARRWGGAPTALHACSTRKCSRLVHVRPGRTEHGCDLRVHRPCTAGHGLGAFVDVVTRDVPPTGQVSRSAPRADRDGCRCARRLS